MDNFLIEELRKKDHKKNNDLFIQLEIQLEDPFEDETEIKKQKSDIDFEVRF